MHMMKLLIYLSIFVFFLGCNDSNDSSDNLLTQQWESLIVGNDLSAWQKMGNVEANIENGELVLKGSGSEGADWLVSPLPYENFKLKAEFLLAPMQNSGIAIRYNDPPGGHPGRSSYEINLFNEQETQNPTGSIFELARAKWLDSLDFSGWNKIEIQAVGDHIVVLLNDEKVSEVHDRRSMGGKIAFEAPEGEARFRKIEIMRFPLSTVSGPLMEEYMRTYFPDRMVSLFDGKSMKGWSKSGDGYWRVEDGALHGYSGAKGGYLISENAYKNFYLKASFKIAYEDNSGIFIRKDPSAQNPGLDNALECNIYDFDGFSHAYSTGAIVTHARAWSKMISYTEWNELEIFAFEDHIVMTINGRKASDVHVPSNFNISGNICLQAGLQIMDEDKGPSHVWFKDMFVKDFGEIPFIGY